MNQEILGAMFLSAILLSRFVINHICRKQEEMRKKELEEFEKLLDEAFKDGPSNLKADRLDLNKSTIKVDEIDFSGFSMKGDDDESLHV